MVKGRREVYREAVLAYYNRCLLERGLITRQAYLAMERQIRQKKTARF